MGNVSKSVQSAMEALGKELNIYLEEARRQIEKKNSGSGEEEHKKRKLSKSFAQKFFGDFYTSKSGSKGQVRSRRDLDKEKRAIASAMKPLNSRASKMTFLMYKNFKKAHRLVMW